MFCLNKLYLSGKLRTLIVSSTTITPSIKFSSKYGFPLKPTYGFSGFAINMDIEPEPN